MDRRIIRNRVKRRGKNVQQLLEYLRKCLKEATDQHLITNCQITTSRTVTPMYTMGSGSGRTRFEPPSRRRATVISFSWSAESVGVDDEK